MKTKIIAVAATCTVVWSVMAATSATAPKDTIVPTVTSFTVPTIVNSTTVPITTFTASDNIGIAAYKVTTTATVPLASATGWSPTRPTNINANTTGAITLYAWAKDKADNISIARKANVTIDTTMPTVTAFTAPTAIKTTVVPITALTATDNVAVAGYMITQSAVRPLATATGWSTARPTSFNAGSVGVKNLYAWVKDTAGNVSIPVTDKVIIDATAPVISTFSIPITATTLEIPITAFSATDSNGVTGYLVTESATTPALTASGWSTDKLSSYTVSASGVKKLYAWVRDEAGNISLSKSASCTVDTTKVTTPNFNMEQSLSDGAQRTTLAFSALAMVTGNLEAQSFFPPGKVADYTGFQYLRDNDPDGMGHNTSFLTRIANNVIHILNDAQLFELQTLAVAQQSQIEEYGYKRFSLMKAFRRLLDDSIPSGSTGLNLNSIKSASRELYLIDGAISYERAALYASIFNSMDSTQKAYLDSMKGKGWKSWPDITSVMVQEKMKALPQGTSVAVMTYASDLFSWYAGSVTADVYFCPERHGTYFGSFYIKDAPAIGHEGYGINEQLTATAGAALSDSSKGYVTQSQAALMSSLVETQRNNLYAGTSNIVKVRTEIATLLRTLLTSGASADSIKTQVLALSAKYGELDGENNYNYATVIAQVYDTLTTAQKTSLAALRKSIMSGTYTDGTAFDYSVSTTPFLYSAVISDLRLLAPYISNTDILFFEP